MSADDDPSPLRGFLAQLDDLRSADALDMDQVGRLLVELAADEEYLGPLSGGTRSATKTAGLNCVSSMTAPCTPATWRR